MRTVEIAGIEKRRERKESEVSSRCKESRQPESERGRKYDTIARCRCRRTYFNYSGVFLCVNVFSSLVLLVSSSYFTFTFSFDGAMKRDALETKNICGIECAFSVEIELDLEKRNNAPQMRRCALAQRRCNANNADRVRMGRLGKSVGAKHAQRTVNVPLLNV